jgi:cobalt/nickel transport system permease protein
VTHLHIPDGILPWWLWAPGFLLAALLLWAISRHHRHDRRDRLALLGTLSALMLAAMALPLGPLGYHLSLAPVVGMVLGSGLAYIAAFVVNMILALLGHGGITVVGLNAVVTGIAAAVGGWVYRLLAPRLAAFWAAAAGAATGMLASLVAWLAVVGIAGLTANPGHGAHELAARAAAAAAAAASGTVAVSGDAGARLARLAVVSFPFWIIGTVAEALVAGGVIGFLSRVSPSLIAESPGSGRSTRVPGSPAGREAGAVREGGP